MNQKRHFRIPGREKRETMVSKDLQICVSTLYLYLYLSILMEYDRKFGTCALRVKGKIRAPQRN